MPSPASALAATAAAAQLTFLQTVVVAPRRRADDAKPSSRRPWSTATDAVRKPRLLWIEDQPELMAPLKALLVREGFEVEFATTGEAGIRMATSATYEVILLDLKLPDARGIDVLRRIRSARTTTPVIVIIGYGSMETAAEAMRAGAADCRSKPLRGPDLVRAIRSAIDASNREQLQRLFRESREDEPPASLGRILIDLSDITGVTEARDGNAWSEARNALRRDLARAASDPQLTLPEFFAVTEALRLIFREERPWPRLALLHVLDLLDAASRRDWRSVDETVRQLIIRLIAAGKGCMHLNEEAVVQELGLDRDRLSALLRQELGLSLPQLRRLVVMRRAVQMLAISDEQVAQIAYAVGYEHPSAFDHAFANFFGVSPRKYRTLIGGRARTDE